MNARMPFGLVCFVCSWFIVSGCNEVITESNGQIRVGNEYIYCSWIFINSEPTENIKLTFDLIQIEGMSYYAEVWNYNSSAIEQYGVYNNEVDSLSIIVPNSAVVIVFMETAIPEFHVTFRHETTKEAVHRVDGEESEYSRRCSRMVHDKFSRMQNEEYPDGPPDYGSCLWFIPIGSSETLKMSLAEVKGSPLFFEKKYIAFWEVQLNQLVGIDVGNADEWKVEHPLFIYWQAKIVEAFEGLRLVYEITSNDTGNWLAEVPTCNQAISRGSGVIASAHYPLQYKENTDCIWLFKPKPPYALHLHVIGMDIYNGGGFEDYLDFWTMSNKGVMFVGDHETLEGKEVITSMQPLLVKFHTNQDLASSGFKILYKFVSQDSQQTAKVDNDLRSFLEIPPYKKNDCQGITMQKWTKLIIHSRYRTVNLNCLWILKRQANESTLIYIPNNIFYLANSFQIWDKFETSMSNLFIDEDKSLFSATGTVMIHLKYSGEWTWANPFDILIRPAKVTKCSQLISKSSDIIQIRAGYLHKKEQNCLWYLKPQLDKKVRLDILESSFNGSTKDFLNIWVLDNNKVSLVSAHKVLETKQTLESTKPIIVQFHSENQITESEWQIKYSFDSVKLGFVSHIGASVPSIPKELKCRRTIIKRDGTIDFSNLRSETEYGKLFVCVWILKRMPGEKTLLYRSLDSPTNYEDYFHIWDQLETSPKLKKFSGLSGKKPSIMTGTVMIQMTAYLYRSSPSVSIQYHREHHTAVSGSKGNIRHNRRLMERLIPLMAGQIQSLESTNQRKHDSRVGHP